MTALACISPGAICVAIAIAMSIGCLMGVVFMACCCAAGRER
jgi:hypothetical protein